MPIVRLLEREAFSPEDVTTLTVAYEAALNMLELVDRTDPLTELVAKKIIECAQTDKRYPIHLRDCALKLLRD